MSDAEVAIGRDDPSSDWKLDPQSHLSVMPPTAAPLRLVLEKSNIQQLIEEYTRYDQEAVQAQKKYRRYRSVIRTVAVFGAAAGLLAVGLHFLVGYVTEIQLLLIASHVVAILSIALMAWRMDAQNWRGLWKEARGKAEWRRIALFEEATSAHPEIEAKNGGSPLLPLQLAYFRRYHLDVQLRFFQGRAKQLNRTESLSRGLTWLAIGGGTAGVAAALMVAVDLAAEQGVTPPLWMLDTITPETASAAAMAFPVLLFSTLYAVLMVGQEPREEARIAQRYVALGANLAFLKAHGYEAVRRAAEAGDRALMEKFITLVNDRLRVEIEEWLSLEDATRAQGENSFASSAVTGLSEILAAEKKLG